MSARLLNFVTVLLLSFGAAAACGFMWFRSQGGVVMSVQSGSMEPLLSKGDLILTKKMPDYTAGDVVTYTNKNSTITHRIISVDEGPMNTQFRTKGDANSIPDNPIQKSVIVGTMVFSVPLVGYGIDFLRTPIGLALFIYMPALLIIIGEFRRLNNYFGGHIFYSRIGVSKRKPPYAAVTIGLIACILGTSAYTFAALESRSALKSSTITIAPQVPSTSTTVQCSTSSTVSIESATDQTAESGAVNESTSNGQNPTTTGSVSNSANTNISISLDGGC